MNKMEWISLKPGATYVVYLELSRF